MNHNTKFNVTAHISNGTTLTFHSDEEIRIFAWCEGVSQTAELFGEGVQFVLEIELDNAAFEDNPGELRQTLAQIPRNPKPGDDGKLTDSNGNTVGSWEVKD